MNWSPQRKEIQQGVCSCAHQG